jgi:hypothetical protein
VRLISVFTTLEGRNLNSLGFQPQVGRATPVQSVRRRPIFGVTPGRPHVDASQERQFQATWHLRLGLKPQAIQIPPFQGGV